MAQRIITTCDPHAGDDPNDDHPGETQPPISLDGGLTWMTADMCSPAAKEFVEPLRELLAEHGRPLTEEDVQDFQRTHRRTVYATKGGSAKFPCPRCDTKPMLRSTLRKHLADEHDWSLPLYEAELGYTLDGGELTVWCPDCGGGFDHGAGLGAHQRSGTCPGQSQQTLLDTDTPTTKKKAPTKRTTKKATAKR